MSLPVPLPYLLKLDRRFANGTRITCQPTAQVILNTGDTSFRDPENHFFMMMHQVSISRTDLVPPFRVPVDRDCQIPASPIPLDIEGPEWQLGPNCKRWML